MRNDDELKNEAARLKAGLPLGDPKQLLTDQLLARDVKNRADVVRELRNLGLEITRTGVDYLSVRPEPGAKPIRLKGPLYESTFQAVSAKPTLRYRNTADDAKRAKFASAELARIVEARSLHNRKRYPYPVDITPNQRLQRTYERAKSSVIASAFSAHEAASTRDAAFERASESLAAASDSIRKIQQATAYSIAEPSIWAKHRIELEQSKSNAALHSFDSASERLKLGIESTIGGFNQTYDEFKRRLKRGFGQAYDEFYRNMEELLIRISRPEPEQEPEPDKSHSNRRPGY